jgi:hypothetical protein
MTNNQMIFRANIVFGSLLTLLISFCNYSVIGQTKAANSKPKDDEQILREIIRQEDERLPKRTENFIYATGRTPRPLIGRKELETFEQSLKPNTASKILKRSTKTEMKRLVVAQSGDLAYDFGDVVFTDETVEGKVTSFNSSYLRTWRKIKGEWLVDAIFVRRNESEQKATPK